MKRLLLLSAVLGAALALAVQPAAATNECRGLQVCVPVAGPWVVVPARLLSPRVRVDFQLSCPRGYAVGGLDAELSERAIEIFFQGKLGSPVGPGTTTGRAALFGATYVGAAARTPTFRPRLGCIPASGGGSGPVPYKPRSILAAYPPGEPTVRRVRNVRLRPGSVRAVAACGAGERFISGWQAIGFYGGSPPSAALVRSAVAMRSARRDRVEVSVRGGAALRTVRAVVQVGAVCGGGS